MFSAALRCVVSLPNSSNDAAEGLSRLVSRARQVKTHFVDAFVGLCREMKHVEAQRQAHAVT